MKPCKYCTEYGKCILKQKDTELGDIYLYISGKYLALEFDNVTVPYDYHHNYNFVSKIKYCPMCGRKL